MRNPSADISMPHESHSISPSSSQSSNSLGENGRDCGFEQPMFSQDTIMVRWLFGSRLMLWLLDDGFGPEMQLCRSVHEPTDLHSTAPAAHVPVRPSGLAGPVFPRRLVLGCSAVGGRHGAGRG